MPIAPKTNVTFATFFIKFAMSSKVFGMQDFLYALGLSITKTAPDDESGSLFGFNGLTYSNV